MNTTGFAAGTGAMQARLPDGAHLSLLTTPASLAALESGWRALEAAHGRPHNVFQTFDWVASWAATFAGPESGQGLAVVAGLRGGALAFVWPLMSMRIGALTVLRWLSEPIGQYGDVLIDRPEELDLWLDASLELLRREAGADTLWLRHVRQDATAAGWIAGHSHDAQLSQRAPWLDLTAYADEVAYDARYDAQQRKRRKKIAKALEADLGPLAFTELPPGPALDAALDQAIAEKNKWIEERGRQNQVMGSACLLKFLRKLSRVRGSTRMVVSAATAGGKPVSWEIGLRYGRTHFAFITSHVTALTDFSPGRLHMDRSQRLALAAGMDVFDLMVPYDPHKESWSSAKMPTADYYLPLSSRGWLFGRLYLASLRPMIRAAYYKLPKSVLRALKPIVGH